MKEVKLGSINEYKDHLSWVDTYRDKDMLIFHVGIESIGLCDYEAILYEYGEHNNKPAKRWKHTGKWKKGYQLSFDMEKDYKVRHGRKYLLVYVFFIKTIEVRYHAFIKI